MTEVDINLHPRSQHRLIGHRDAFEQVINLFNNGKIPPAWIISGQRGIGKATFCYELAKSILSKGPLSSEQVHRQIAAGTYPNLSILERLPSETGKETREISIDQARSLGQTLKQSAAIPGWRVVIIDAADELNRNAANSLLKLIEEPPSLTLLLLVTHSFGQLLPTLRSRCCHLRLDPLPTGTLSDLLGDDPILPYSHGSLGKAVRLKSAGGVMLLQKLIEAITASTLGQFTKVQQFISSFAKGDPVIDIVLDLIEEITYRLSIFPFTDRQDTFLNHLLPLRSPQHWVEVWKEISSFLALARSSHLDQNHLLMTLFFIIDNPKLGNMVSL
jgi:DNA polymerase-3 subunit delta'